MDNYTAVEEAYKNGYEKGKQDAMKQCAVTREKLIELVRDARGNAAWHNAPNPAEYVADFLIANGVTVQKWIPVSEPPKDHKEYIVMIKGAKCPTTLWYRPSQKNWYEAGGDKPHIVTHWMPLPQAPKEG